MDIWPVQMPYKKPFTTSRGTVSQGISVIVKVLTDRATVGVGEASIIFPDRSGETQATVVDVLQHGFGPALLGKDPFDLESIMESLNSIGSDRYSFPYSKCAVDHALYDLMGKALGVPVYKLIGGIFRRQIGVGRSLSIQPETDLAVDAKEKKEAGYKMLTLKGSCDWQGDIHRFMAVRQAVGRNFPLEIDPNQAYSVKQAIRVARTLEQHGLANIEQPCAWWDLDGMAEIRRSVSVPITADESVHSPVDAMRVVKNAAADMITIKLACSGGIFFARKKVAIAEAGGLSCNVGSKHTLGVGTAAIIHFAAATPVVEEPIGYGSPLERFVDDVIVETIPLREGTVEVFDAPGLGVTLDETKLRQYALGGPYRVRGEG